MTLIEKVYRPVWYLRFTKAETRILKTCSERHYDALCQAQSKPGGTIFGLRNFPECSLKFRDIDLMCKILEQGGLVYRERDQRLACNKLFTQLHALLREESLCPR